MSDDEMAPVSGLQEDDMSDDMGDVDELPAGVDKEILTEASPSNWKTPKPGDEVTVHYVGTLQSDGSEFDSSRGRNQPFNFTLGRGQVIKGWDVGVATMKKGEISKFTLAPEFAYGAAGSPPKIPENATLVFEIELISWMSKDDLFGDEGVIKTLVREGSGYKSPKLGDEVLLSMKAATSDGTVVEEVKELEYVLGSDGLGAAGKACDKALVGMKKGEESELKCTKDYAYGDRTPEGAVLTLNLLQIYETKDVSFQSDKAVMKKMIAEGEDYDLPKEGQKVKLTVESATDGSKSALPGFVSKELEFPALNGEVCDALECAAASMKTGERAVLTTSPAQLADGVLGLSDVKAEKVLLTVKMNEFEKGKDTWSLSEDEKVEFGAARKEVGSNLFKTGRIVLALENYKKVGQLLSYVENFQNENKAKAQELKKVCSLNKAACYLKLKEHHDAKAACDAVLKEESQNVKALYRRAQAQFGMKNFADCMADCKRLLEIDSQNRDARVLLKQAMAGQKEEDKKSKGLFANMCKALGKGPIPPPGQSKPIGMDMDEEDADADMADAAPEGGA